MTMKHAFVDRRLDKKENASDESRRCQTTKWMPKENEKPKTWLCLRRDSNWRI